MVNLDDSPQFSQVISGKTVPLMKRKETMLPSLARQNANLDLIATKA